MKLTKIQLIRFRELLDRTATEKLNAFKEKRNLSKLDLWGCVSDAFKNGEVRLKSSKQIKNVVIEKATDRGYCGCVMLTFRDLINEKDLEVVRKRCDDGMKQINEYGKKLEKAKAGILDKMILEDLNIDTALAEFDKL